ncbi:GntR family transcriptional regulator [Agrobacterium sp. ES01]|uniref:GntR family transcriptional regulator n=1 Tax=Agrobacterium sp. ES01 TaxID=3420714 RepID=UPI003D0D8FD0
MTDFQAILSKDQIVARGPGPLYVNLQKILDELISERRIEPGTALPTERDLAEMSGLSRVTVRKAVDELVQRGHLVRRQGSGTFVAHLAAKVEQPLSKLTSFSEDMARRGLETKSVWLNKGVFSPSPNETMVLGLSHDIDVVRLERLRTGGGMPLAIELAAISTEFLPDPDLVTTSLYQALKSRGHNPVRATQRISARNSDEREAELLGIEVGSAVLQMERVTYLSTGRVIEFTRSVYRGDTYDFVAELRVSDNNNQLVEV